MKDMRLQTIAVLLVASPAVTNGDADETETFVGRCVDFDVEDSYILLVSLDRSILEHSSNLRAHEM